MLYIKLKNLEVSVIFMMVKKPSEWVLKLLLIPETIHLIQVIDVTVKLIPEVGHLKKSLEKSLVNLMVVTEDMVVQCTTIKKMLTSMVVTVLSVKWLSVLVTLSLLNITETQEKILPLLCMVMVPLTKVNGLKPPIWPNYGTFQSFSSVKITDMPLVLQLLALMLITIIITEVKVLKSQVLMLMVTMLLKSWKKQNSPKNLFSKMVQLSWKLIHIDITVTLWLIQVNHTEAEKKLVQPEKLKIQSCYFKKLLLAIKLLLKNN